MYKEVKDDSVSVKVMVYFEEPFWIAFCERTSDEGLSVCKITFGPEPKDYEVREFLLKNWYQLPFSRFVENVTRKKEINNPKRRQRSVKKELAAGTGTKSQQALKMIQEETKKCRKIYSKEQKEARKEQLFVMKQEKRKEKHKGR